MNNKKAKRLRKLAQKMAIVENLDERDFYKFLKRNKKELKLKKG